MLLYVYDFLTCLELFDMSDYIELNDLMCIRFYYIYLCMLIAYGRHLFFGFCEWQEIMQMKGLEIICVSTNKPGNTPSVFIPSDTFWHQNKLSDVFIFILLLQHEIVLS